MSDLEIAERAARAAGAQLREAFADVASLATQTKSTVTDPVSEADTAAERLIREHLPPGDAVLGEEGGAKRGDTGRRWIVDPLDGTVNFLYGIPQWCVSIALEGVCGVVYDAMRDELWAAAAGGPATCNGVRVTPSGVTDLSMALVATGYGYDPRARAIQADMQRALMPRVRDVRRFGSAALDMVWTAGGRYDGYAEHGVKPWDVEAGRIICTAAGLTVRDLPEREILGVGILAAGARLADDLEPFFR